MPCTEVILCELNFFLMWLILHFKLLFQGLENVFKIPCRGLNL